MTVMKMRRSTENIDKIEIREGLKDLTGARIMTLYRRAPLFRPLSSARATWEMLQRSSVVLSAWHDNELVGLARAMSDGVVFTYLCDLAVEPDVQGLGVGRRLFQAVIERSKGTELIFRDPKLSAQFYDALGFRKAGNTWSRKC